MSNDAPALKGMIEGVLCTVWKGLAYGVGNALIVPVHGSGAPSIMTMCDHIRILREARGFLPGEVK